MVLPACTIHCRTLYSTAQGTIFKISREKSSDGSYTGHLFLLISLKDLQSLLIYTFVCKIDSTRHKYCYTFI